MLLSVQEEGVRKVYDIFVSNTLDVDVRKSAADQLAIMVQGTGWITGTFRMESTTLTHCGLMAPNHYLN